MSLTHGLNGPPSAWITSNRLETALEEQLHTMVVDPTPRAKIPSWLASPRFLQVGGFFNRHCKKEYCVYDQKSVNPKPPDIFTPHAQLHVKVTSADVPAYKPCIGTSTDLQSSINSSPHLTSKAQ